MRITFGGKNSKNPFSLTFKWWIMSSIFTFVGETHLSKWYHLLCFRPENTAQYFSKPISVPSENYEAIFSLPRPRFSSFFAILTIFTSKLLHGRQTYLTSIICFVFVHKKQPDTFPSPFWDVQNATRLYSSSKNTLLLTFFAFSLIFTCTKALYARHTYLIGTFCFVFFQRIQFDTFPSPF